MVKKKVLVFGVFDRLHEGHIHFLLEAKALGDCLVVAVAQDSVVLRLKGKEPRVSLEKRMVQLKRLDFVDEVVSGDEEKGNWGVLKSHSPGIVALGYDQVELKEALEPLSQKFNFSIKVLNPYEPEKFHSSILNK